MTRKRHIELKFNNWIPNIYLILLIFFLILLTIEIIAGRINSVVPVIVLFIFLSPFILMYLWFKTYKCELKDDTIYVRRRFGFVRCNFHVSNIKSIKQESTETNARSIHNVRIISNDDKFIDISPDMTNFDKMMDYLSKNVDEEKFETKIKNIKDKK